MTELLASFRDAMAQVAAPVSIVTTAIGGNPFGATVSAFASLSLRPPMVLVALDDRGSLVGQIQNAGRFALNLLGAHQSAASVVFAEPGATDRFEHVTWEWLDGLPHVTGSVGWVPCEVDRVAGGGDHTLFLGRVLRAEADPAPPLNYHQRRYVTTTPIG